jgi:endonuclease YncB( thermonuclease family)
VELPRGRRLGRKLLIAGGGALLAGAALAVIPGMAHVTDGDTFVLGGERIRIWGIDAPEGGQTCLEDGRPVRLGRQATWHLVRLVGISAPSCRLIDIDRYGRSVSICMVDDLDLGAEMVRAGLAWDYRQYSDGTYAREEAEARAAGRGIWAATCDPPWEWRRTHLRAS